LQVTERIYELNWSCN